jgi:hypothetical protein
MNEQLDKLLASATILDSYNLGFPPNIDAHEAIHICNYNELYIKFKYYLSTKSNESECEKFITFKKVIRYIYSPSRYEFNPPPNSYGMISRINLDENILNYYIKKNINNIKVNYVDVLGYGVFIIFSEGGYVLDPAAFTPRIDYFD